MTSIKAVIKEVALNALLRLRANEALIRRSLARRRYPRPARAGGDRLVVAAVQARIHFVPDGVAFAAELCEQACAAVAAGAQLVVFPEDIGSNLLGLLPGVAELAGSESLDAAVRRLAGPGVSVGDAFRRVSGAAWRAYDATFASLARRLGVYLVAGSIVLVEGDGRLRNVAHVYGPDGRLVARQPKLHLFPDEAGWGIAPGDDLQVFATPWCQMAVAVCMDMTYWEWARIATGRGAEVLVCPSANPAPYNAWEELRGTWGRVQESPAYGVFCSAFGDVAGLTIRGRSAVLAPLELSPSGDGVLAQAEAPDRPAVVVAELDLAALRRFRAECGPEPNRELLRRYLPAVYG